MTDGMLNRILRGLAGALVIGVLAGCAGGGAMRSASEAQSTTAADSPARARAKAHTELAADYFQNGHMAVALSEIGIAMDADRNYAPAYNVLGLVQMYLKENEPAEANFLKALELAPADPEINNNYGWFLCQNGRERDSFKFFIAAVKNTLYQTPEKSLLNAGHCAARINDLKGAEEYYQKALVMGRNTQAVLLPMAQLEYRKGDFHEARHYLGEFHRVAVPNAESLLLGIRVERKLGNVGVESDYSSQLRRRFPDSKEARELRRGLSNE